MQVGFGKDDGAGLPEFADLEGIVGGNRSRQRDRAARRRHVARVVIVLEDDRYPVQRTPRSALGTLPIQHLGPPAGERVDPDDGVQPRVPLIIGLDPCQVGIDEFGARHAAPRHRLP